MRVGVTPGRFHTGVVEGLGVKPSRCHTGVVEGCGVTPGALYTQQYYRWHCICRRTLHSPRLSVDMRPQTRHRTPGTAHETPGIYRRRLRCSATSTTTTGQIPCAPGLEGQIPSAQGSKGRYPCPGLEGATTTTTTLHSTILYLT